MGFANIAPNGTPVTITNQLANFGWEYVWHCHILGHEENDMMRPIDFIFVSTPPAAPTLGVSNSGGNLLTWSDATPFEIISPAGLTPAACTTGGSTLAAGGQCTLVVRSVDGKGLGTRKGSLCVLALTGHAGDVWSFEATSSVPNAEIQLAFANPVFPSPLNRVAQGGVLLLVVALLGVLLSCRADRSLR